MDKHDIGHLKIITADELEANDGTDGNRLWICIKNIVYDVTDFHEHPGGMEEFINVGGKDATENFEEVGHSATAVDLMSEYVVGRLAIENDKN
ncbi:Cytochrome b5 [Babesia microti strain RI]|uniref:Cytochrome b5 n=1 Tax=Babesia microti (strain RI) TaxID=1133968 RepID=A0A0K3ASM3_BABMR|nr:Cytochrome b5 [Babesia microti strain RI]CTQ41455.1 Cytochrome b5 [Babesia microti strain RI]|eukprot:XP_012649466.1 Cytochrome b5 [Babesia microti strain RI]